MLGTQRAKRTACHKRTCTKLKENKEEGEFDFKKVWTFKAQKRHTWP